MGEIKINEKERMVLEVLASDFNSESPYHYFKGIATKTGLEIKEVSRACRSLKKKGLAEYMRGLFNDDGEAAGSGYGATEAGYNLIKPKDVV